jgi:RNA polymerase sigma-70 factor (ECF subfamily)
LEAWQEFDTFVEATRRRLFGQAFLYTSNLQEAEDLLQETYLRAWCHWSTVAAANAPEAWARRVLGNLAIDASRARARRRRMTTAYESDAGVPQLTGTQYLEITEGLQMLRPKHRRVLVLQAVVGLSIEEIAADMGASEATVRSWLSRCCRSPKFPTLDHRKSPGVRAAWRA